MNITLLRMLPSRKKMLNDNIRLERKTVWEIVLMVAADFSLRSALFYSETQL